MSYSARTVEDYPLRDVVCCDEACGASPQAIGDLRYPSHCLRDFPLACRKKVFQQRAYEVQLSPKNISEWRGGLCGSQ